MQFALTYHVEAPRDTPSNSAYDEVIRQVELADRLGFDYAWFSEHHAHAHYGHLPCPLLLALHLAGRTKQIKLGTAIICLNLHHPVAVAEQVAVADVLTDGRMSIGFGSGSTPEEFAMFAMDVTEPGVRHERFEEALRVILRAWSGRVCHSDSIHYQIPDHEQLPIPSADLHIRSWLAVNSVDSARIAGKLGFNMMFSHLRTPEQYRDYRKVYADVGGQGLVAANRPIYVGESDESAYRDAEPALRTLWRRFHSEGKIAADTTEPENVEGLCAHPINFLLGGPESVAQQISELHEQVPFDVINLEPQWAGLSPALAESSLARIAYLVVPSLKRQRA